MFFPAQTIKKNQLREVPLAILKGVQLGGPLDAIFDFERRWFPGSIFLRSFCLFFLTIFLNFWRFVELWQLRDPSRKVDLIFPSLLVQFSFKNDLRSLKWYNNNGPILLQLFPWLDWVSPNQYVF